MGSPDFAAKILTHTSYGEFALNDALVDEAKALVVLPGPLLVDEPPANLLEAVKAARARL